MVKVISFFITKREPQRAEAVKKFLEIYQPESLDDIYDSLKDMLGETIEVSIPRETLENLNPSLLRNIKQIFHILKNK